MIKGLAITPPILGRISIGRVIEKNGKRLPEKDDQFTLTSQVQNRDGWVLHPLDEELRKTSANGKLRRAQWVTSAWLAFSHGANDAQKSMGIITLALVAYIAAGHAAMPTWMLPEGKDVPQWVILACAAAIGLGTMAGGKRIIKTMGAKIIRITPLQGFAAETAGTATILTASAFGVPVSTTHCISACIMGVGASKRLSAVRWGVAGNIVLAWVLTIPMSAGFAFLALYGLRAIFGDSA